MSASGRPSSELARLRGARSAGLQTILFVCTGNSIRSQMAEALINHHYAGRWAAFSAGTLPRPLHAETVAVLGEVGIDATRQFAKHADAFRDADFDRVVVLCADADRHCPVFPHGGGTDRLTFEDPLWTDALAGAIVFSYKPRLRALRDEMMATLFAYIDSGARLPKGASSPARPRRNWWRRLLGGSADASPEPVVAGPQVKYAAFKQVLAHNQAALENIAQLEGLYYGADGFGMAAVQPIYDRLLASLFGLIHAFETLTGHGQPLLQATLRGIDADIGPACENRRHEASGLPLVLPFAAIDEQSRPQVGTKAGNLALIGSQLGLPVPAGFAITAQACRHFLAQAGLDALIERELADFPAELDAAAVGRCQRIQDAIGQASIDPVLAAAIDQAFVAMAAGNADTLRVAMRSSAIGEDTESTFAGQYATLLNVGRAGLLDAYRAVVASKYSPQAVSYRQRYGLEDDETPMCVAAVAMVDAHASGVVYSRDPARPGAGTVKVSAVLGLGEQLVDGSTAPDTWLVDRDSRQILEPHIVGKRWRLVSQQAGGVGLEATTLAESLAPAIDDSTVQQLADHCLRLESYFGGPQDIEWASDAAGRIFLLQSRPLLLPSVDSADRQRVHAAGHPLVLEYGVTAAPGVAAGTAFVVRQDADLLALPDDAILVVPTAAPKYVAVAGRIRGLIADTGSAASHLASVAREFGLPAIFDCKIATRTLMTGDQITLAADAVAVYAGIVPELAAEARPQRKTIIGSPAHQRTRAMLDRITPLTLTDPHAPTFTAGHCRSCHDIVRYIHEMAVREMFGLSGDAAGSRPLVLKSRLPLDMRLIDLGGAVRLDPPGATILPEDIHCRPLAALWRGLGHPGIDWRGTMNTGGGLLSRLAAPATAEFGEQPGGESFALVSPDYLNFSLRFAYHFATIDALCGDASAQNYVTLQFAGGGGSFYGRALRIQFISAVLARLGFEVTTTGDVLRASFARHDAMATEERLDQLGRLLASSKLLDMVLGAPDDIERCCTRFFAGDYDFLVPADAGRPPNLYVQDGSWRLIRDDERDVCIQDGSGFGRRIGQRLAGTLARLAGSRANTVLDGLAAAYYFPLAVARERVAAPAALSVRVRPAGGRIDRAGGLAFAIRDIENYLVFRINALEQNAMLFEFRNGRRDVLAEAPIELRSGLWYDLGVEFDQDGLRAQVDGHTVLDLPAQPVPPGFIGLWTKADSTTWFTSLTVDRDGQRQPISF